MTLFFFYLFTCFCGSGLNMAVLPRLTVYKCALLRWTPSDLPVFISRTGYKSILLFLLLILEHLKCLVVHWETLHNLLKIHNVWKYLSLEHEERWLKRLENHILFFFCHLSLLFAYIFPLPSYIAFKDLINMLTCASLEMRKYCFEYFAIKIGYRYDHNFCKPYQVLVMFC